MKYALALLMLIWTTSVAAETVPKCLTASEAKALWPDAHLWWHGEGHCWDNHRGGSKYRNSRREPEEPVVVPAAPSIVTTQDDLPPAIANPQPLSEPDMDAIREKAREAIRRVGLERSGLTKPVDDPPREVLPPLWEIVPAPVIHETPPSLRLPIMMALAIMGSLPILIVLCGGLLVRFIRRKKHDRSLSRLSSFS